MMNKVKRWWANWHMQEYVSNDNGQYVLASDYDAAQSELAALREDLARQKRYVEINANSAHGKHKEGQQYKDERDALREELAEANGALAIANETLGQLADCNQAAEQRNAAVQSLSGEALDVVVGMVEHCLNVRACMGMDEGYKDYLNEEDEHDFVKEIRAFVAALKPTESGASA